MSRPYSSNPETTKRRRRFANQSWGPTAFSLALAVATSFVVVGITTRHAAADPNYIANLTFFDRSPGSPRAKPYDSVLRLDANDTSFASLAGWGGEFSSWQQQFDHTKALAASHPKSGLVFVGDSVTQNWGNVEGRQVNG